MLLYATNLSKHIGGRVLFENVSLKVHAKDKIGLIGPNGAGKSTLLKMLAHQIEPDSGEVTTAKYAKVAYLAQTESFEEHLTLEQVVINAQAEDVIDTHEKTARAAIHLSKMGFADIHQTVANLSGGWRKRLAIAAQLAREPDVLLLDEPTNHLDLEGINWLEKFLKNAKFAFIVISHDRTFLENAVTSVIEVNDCFPDCTFRADGNYSYFLTHRQAFLEGQISQLESMANKARREDAWLKQGIKARGTRQKARSSNADAIFDELKSLKARTVAPKKLKLDFQDTERKTKRLVVAHNISKSFGESTLIQNLDITLTPKTCLGLIGYNGSGKTTLMHMLGGELEPDTGTVTTASGVRIALFDQKRKLVDKDQTLKQALTPSGGDAVIYQDKQIHVASWAKQLKFRSDQLDTPVGALSGGEQARIMLGQLMLTQSDVLLLDEPTNDLDIPSLEVLEESLSTFPGAVVLVTHDRAMLDRVSNILLGLDGKGGVTPYASVAQWQNGKTPEPEEQGAQSVSAPEKQARKVSYKVQKEMNSLEKQIAKAEDKLAELEQDLPDGTDLAAAQTYYETLSVQQAKIDALYTRWEELAE